MKRDWQDRFIAWTLALALAFFPVIGSVRIAQAISPQIKATVLDYHRASAPSGGGFSLTPLAVQTADGTNATPSGTVTYGTTNLLMIAFIWGATNAVTAVSVGGQALTQCISAYHTEPNRQVDWWYKSSPTGTSGALSVTVTGGLNDGMVAQPYAVTTTTTTPSSCNNGGTSFGASASASITPPAGGAILGIGGNGAVGLVTLSPLTLDNNPISYNNQFGGPQGAVAGHSTTASGSTAVTVTDGVNNGNWVLSLAAIAP